MRYFCTVLLLFLSVFLLRAQEKIFNLPLPEKPTEFQKAWLELDPDCGKDIKREIKDIKNINQLWQAVHSYRIVQTSDNNRNTQPDYPTITRFVSWMIMYHGEKVQQNYVQQWIHTFDRCRMERKDLDRKNYCRQWMLLFKTFPISVNWTPSLFQETVEQRLWREKNFPSGRPATGDFLSFPKLKEKLPSKELMELFALLDTNPHWNGGKNPERSPLSKYLRLFLMALAFDETDIPADQIDAFLEKHKEFIQKYDLYGFLFVQIEPSLRERDFKTALNILGKTEIPQNKRYHQGFPFFATYHNLTEFLQRLDSAKPTPVLEWDMRCAEFNALLTDAASRGESVFSAIRREIDTRGDRYLMTKDPDLFYSSLPAFRRFLLGEYGETYHKKLNAFFELQKKNDFLTDRGVRFSYDAYSLEQAKMPPVKTSPRTVPALPEKLAAPERIFDFPSSLNVTNVMSRHDGNWRLPPASVSCSGGYTFFRNMKELVCYYKGELLWRMQDPPISINQNIRHLRTEPVFVCGDLAITRRLISSSYYSANFGLQAFDLKTGREVWSFIVPGANVVDFAVADDGIAALIVGNNLAQQTVLNLHAIAGGNNSQMALVRLDPEKGTTVTARILSDLNRNVRSYNTYGFTPRMLVCGNMIYVDTDYGMFIAFDRAKWETRWMRRYAFVGQHQQYLDRLDVVRRTSYVYYNSSFSFLQTHSTSSMWHPLMLTAVNDVIECGADRIIHAPYGTDVMMKIDKKDGSLLGEVIRPKGMVLGDEQAIFVVTLDHKVTVFDPASMTKIAQGKLSDLAMILKDRSGNGKLAVYEEGKIILRDRNWKIVSELVLPEGFAPLHGGADQALYLFREAGFDSGIYQAVKTLGAEKNVELVGSNDPVLQNMTNAKLAVSVQNMRNIEKPSEEDFRTVEKIFSVYPCIFPHLVNFYNERTSVYDEEGQLIRPFRLGNARGFIVDNGTVLMMPHNVARFWASKDYLFTIANNEFKMYSRKDGSLVAVSGKFLDRREKPEKMTSRDRFNPSRNTFVSGDELFVEMSGSNGVSYCAMGIKGRRGILPMEDHAGKRMPPKIFSFPSVMTRYGWIHQGMDKNRNITYELYDYSALDMLKVATKQMPVYLDGLINLLKEEAAAKKQGTVAKSVLPQIDPADKQKWNCPVANTENPRYVFLTKPRFELYAPYNKFLIWDTKTGKQHILTLPEAYPKNIVRNHNRVTMQAIYAGEKYLILNVFYDLNQIHNTNAKQIYFIYDLETGKEVAPGFASVVLPQKMGDRFYGIRSNFNGKVDQKTQVQLKVVCADIPRKKMVELTGKHIFELSAQYYRSNWEIQPFRHKGSLFFVLSSNFYGRCGGAMWEVKPDGMNVAYDDIASSPVYFVTDDHFVLSSNTPGVSRSSIYPLSLFLKTRDVKIYDVKQDAEFQKAFVVDGYPDEWDSRSWNIHGKNAWQLKLFQNNQAAVIVRIGDPALVEYLSDPERMQKCSISTGDLRGGHNVNRQQAKSCYIDPISGAMYFEFQIQLNYHVSHGVSSAKNQPKFHFTFDFLPFSALPHWGVFGEGCSILLSPRIRIVK